MIEARYLAAASRRARRQSDRASAATLERDELICLAAADGWPYSRIAEAVGLTKARVQQIVEAGR